ncbi:MAG: hypothetical protein GY856_11215 [bacterium]|nr:hypothetical protein [bacterium]
MLPSSALPAQEAPSFKIVVNASSPVSSMSRAVIAKVFLKKITAWDDRRSVLPVDQGADSAVRRGFTEAIHGKSVANIKGYWRKMIFSGDAAPPPEMSSDNEVLSYVGSNADAIGYVSGETPVGDDVKTLTVTGKTLTVTE